VAAAALGGLAVAALLIGPILVRGAGPNMVQAIGRLGAHDMLSGYGLNFWWIVTWVVRALHALELGTFTAFTLPVRILGISRFMEVGYPDPKPLAAGIVSAAIVWATWRVRRTASLTALALAGAWCVYFYAMFNTQVHENHAYLVVPVLAVAAGLAPALRPLFWWISSLTALNMYLFYGVGAEWSPMINRRMTVIDLSVIVSMINLVVLVPLTSELLMRTRKPERIAGTY
jgi:thiamine transporter ThiT